MHQYATRKNKNVPLLEIKEIEKLEKTNRKAKRESEMVNTVVLVRNDDGKLLDLEGNLRNELGQKLDAEGNPIVEEVDVDDHVDRQAHNGVDRHGGQNNENEVDDHVDRQARNRVDRQARNAAGQHLAAAEDEEEERTLAEYNRPNQFYTNRSAIRPPPFQRNDFELKPQYYTLVGQHPFHALSHEHPMDHIEKFEDLASSIKANGVSEDYLFCKLFPYSLAGEAARWLKQLKPGSLTTWIDTKRAFLENFYDDAKSEDLRTLISQFTQGPTETLKNAWLRFKGYQRDCPHHGFNEVQLLRTFFSGIDWRYQMALDAASNGNFNTRRPREASELIENLASSNSTKNADFERKNQAASMNNGQMAEVKAKLDSVHNLLVNKKSVHFAQEVEICEQQEDCNEEDVNYVNGFNGQRFGNYQGSYRNFGQNSPRNNYGNNQNSSGFVPKSDALNTQKSNSSFTRNYGSSYYQNPPPKTPDSEMKEMLDRILEGQQKMTVDFNGKIDALYTDLNGKYETLNSHIKRLDIQIAQNATAAKRPEGVLPGKPDTNPKYQCNAVMSWGEMVKRDTPKKIEIRSEVKEDIEILVKASMSIDTVDACRSTHSTFPTNVPKIDHIDRHTHTGVDRHTQQATKVFLRKLPKVEDPGRFAVPCSIVGIELKDSLCDTGSSVNLMSKSIATRLGICDIKDSPVGITLADASVKTSTGCVENLQVRIRDCLIPCDFHIVEMTNGANMPLILGRPFLATAGAVVDLPSRRISLKNVDPDMFYNAVPDGCEMLSPTVATESIEKASQQREVNKLHNTDGNPHAKGKSATKRKPRRRTRTADPLLTLTPARQVGDTIEYKLQYGGTSRSFAKVRAIITPEFKAKGQAALDVMMSRVLKPKLMNLTDEEFSSRTSSLPSESSEDIPKT